MKIQFTPISKTYLQNKISSDKKSPDTINNEYSYNPIVYKDYNINFGARLFRSPENFYEQDFNKEGMPKTLYDYIYNPKNFDFRRKIPPAQAMKEVFGPIAYLTSLEQVKKAYPEEPLFQDLHSKPSKNAKTGVLGELALMKTDKDYEDKTLFKNGKNDRGMYIIKKIYVEGKTLKEINKDFHSDISVAYKGLSDIQYSDLKAFGIHFPNTGFWKSFTATREDFPYVYIPRGEHSVTQVEHTMPKPAANKAPRAKMDYTQRKRISEFMINWHAGLTPEEKAELIKKQKLGIENTPLHKYFGEIVTIAQDKVNLAGVMANYFEKIYGNPDYEEYLKSHKDKQAEIMTKFWKKNERLKNQYSKAMIDTIAEFDKAYGEDGTSDDLTLLIEIAQEISDKNEENRQLRKANRKLANAEKIKTDEQKPLNNYYTLFNTGTVEKKKNIYRLNKNTEIALDTDLKQAYHQKLTDKYSSLPQSYVNKIERILLKNPKFTELYLVSAFYHDKKAHDRYIQNLETEYNIGFMAKDKAKYLQESDFEILDSIQNELMTEDEVKKISSDIFQELYTKNANYIDTVKEVIIETLNVFPMQKFDEIIVEMNNIYSKLEENNLLPTKLDDNTCPIDIDDLKNGVTESLNLLNSHMINFIYLEQIAYQLQNLGIKFTPKQLDFINKEIEFYQQPLTNRDIPVICNKLADKLIDFDDYEVIQKDSDAYLIMKTAMEYFKKYPKSKKLLVELLRNKYVKPEKGYLKYFLIENAPDKLTNIKLEKIMADIWTNEDNRDSLEAYCLMDTNIMEKNIKPVNENLYKKLMLLYKGAMNIKNNPLYYNTFNNSLNNNK